MKLFVPLRELHPGEKSPTFSFKVCAVIRISICIQVCELSVLLTQSFNYDQYNEAEKMVAKCLF